MIPLKTLPDAPRKPFWTRVIAASIALVWLLQLGLLALGGRDLAQEFGVRPVCYFHPSSCGVEVFPPPPLHVEAGLLWAQSPPGRLVLAPLASLWLHADWWHVGFNLLFLLVFGGALEGEIGRWRFLRLYFGGALVATSCHVALHAGSDVATIGASGAIAALLGAHFWCLPRAWVLTYFPPVFLLPVPSALFGALWIGFQLLGAWRDFHLPFVPLASGARAGGASIAWAAHLGGFAWGAWASFRSSAGRTRRRSQNRHDNR